MVRGTILAIALAGGLTCPFAMQLRGDESKVVEKKIGEQTVRLQLTGSAVRTKSIFKVYTIDSYVEAGVKVRTAEELMDADAPKLLHLVMLRNVSGPEMSDAFVSLLRANHPEPAFEDEVKSVATLLRNRNVHKGDEIWFSHIPKVGIQCHLGEDMTHLVRNVAFSKAVWGNYFGKHNVGEHVKKGLLSRLPQE